MNTHKDTPIKTQPLTNASIVPVVTPVKKTVGSVVGVFQESGALPVGVGKITGVIALSLGILCFLGVLAFHFPQYLTTPELRQKYSVDLIRYLMLAALLIGGSLSLVNVVFNRHRWLSMAALALILVTVVLGGSAVPVADFPDNTPYIGLDWFILDLLGSSAIFITLEKLLPFHKGQVVFRFEWQTDFAHFIVNHFLVGLMLLLVNFFAHKFFGWAVYAPLQSWVQGLNNVLELLLAILVADLVQYWTHRAYHEVPYLWRFHAVHHSTKVMDWMAGSRLHLMEIISTRVLVLGALYLMGFSKSVMDIYIVIVGLQAVLNHANVDVPWGWLKYIIVTPNFHHWHHSSDQAALDRNYAAHYAFLDYLFGTAVKTDQKLPDDYGVLGDYMPAGFVNQQLYPFTLKQKVA
jgi:sterol desaturase/sphingolipid hydroxylase (fatty acid hydroxylase superfamily)